MSQGLRVRSVLIVAVLSLLSAPSAAIGQVTNGLSLSRYVGNASREVRRSASTTTYVAQCEAVNVDYSEPWIELIVAVYITVDGVTVSQASDSGYGFVYATAVASFPSTPEWQRVECHSVTTGGNLYDFFDAPSVPTGEATDSCWWFLPFDSACGWIQTLQPASGFAGRWVTERDGGGGPDTCWFEGSTVLKSESITGGQWPVDSFSRWYYDSVGWKPVAVQRYRNYGRVPCETQFWQRMEIDWPGEPGLWMPYTVNLLRMGMTATTVWSERAGRFAERVWP